MAQSWVVQIDACTCAMIMTAVGCQGLDLHRSAIPALLGSMLRTGAASSATLFPELLAFLTLDAASDSSDEIAAQLPRTPLYVMATGICAAVLLWTSTHAETQFLVGPLRRSPFTIAKALIGVH